MRLLTKSPIVQLLLNVRITAFFHLRISVFTYSQSINSAKDDNKTIGSIDACHFGNISRFINSSCEPNCVPVKVFVDHQVFFFIF